MMSLSVISFTENGIRLSEKVAEQWTEGEVTVFTKCSAAGKEQKENAVSFVEESIGEWTREQMEKRNSLLFIGACGIAVRAIAPCVTDKLHDSPVLVMDERGDYIISILSGHMGGANRIATQIAEALGAVPVITTATDINGKFAIDLFAKKNGLHIINKSGIAKVSAKVLAGKTITVSIEGEQFHEESKKPDEVYLVSYPPKHLVDVLITTEKKKEGALLYLRPREYVIGVGCKRGKEAEKIADLIQRTLDVTGIQREQIYALASIDRKKDEEALLLWSQKENVPFLTFPAEELQSVTGSIHSSNFVQEQVGVDNVCERAALKACGDAGTLVFEKHAEDGMTIAIAKRDWRIVFDEE